MRNSGEQTRLERQLKELQRGKAKVIEASEASDKQIKEAAGLKQSLAAKTAEAAASSAALADLKDDLEASQQRVNEEKDKVKQISQKMDELFAKYQAAEMYTATLEQQLAGLKQVDATNAARQSLEASRLNDVEEQLADERAKNQALEQRRVAELKRVQADLDSQMGLLQAAQRELGEETVDLVTESLEEQAGGQLLALVSDKKALVQEVATLKQCKEKLEATLLQERQRASDGLVALEALERRLSDEKSSHRFEQERLEGLQKMSADLSTSRASELQHLKEQLVRLKFDSMGVAATQDAQRTLEDAEKSRLADEVQSQKASLAEAIGEKSRLEAALREAVEEVRTAANSQRSMEESFAGEIKDLRKRKFQTETLKLEGQLEEAWMDNKKSRPLSTDGACWAKRAMDMENSSGKAFAQLKNLGANFGAEDLEHGRCATYCHMSFFDGSEMVRWFFRWKLAGQPGKQKLRPGTGPRSVEVAGHP
eukprot:Skav207792  [mRNA]  locus=scaffold710:60656:65843:- [translate_table: standard]